MTSCLFPLWMGQIMYNMFRLGFCLIKKKKKKKKKPVHVEMPFSVIVQNAQKPAAKCTYLENTAPEIDI